LNGDDALELKDLRDVADVAARIVAALEKNDIDAATQDLHQVAGLVAGRLMVGSGYDVHQAPHRIHEFLEKEPPDVSGALEKAREFHRVVNEGRLKLEQEVTKK
jgi:hypothetical protein